jgi:cytochrome c peroxidase
MSSCGRSPVTGSLLTVLSVLALAACGRSPLAEDGGQLRPLALGSDSFLAEFSNESGRWRTVSTAGRVDQSNPFFQELGTNGRSCATCHQADDAWTITPAKLQARFKATDGRDPVFRLVDGANSPRADVSTTKARRAAYSMLLTKGVIRVGLPIPEGAEFTLAAVDDPYGFASARELSLFRRVLPSVSVAKLSTVMWDGREMSDLMDVAGSLAVQASNATIGHAEGLAALTQEQRLAIVAFESGIFSAQVYDNAAGDLSSRGALGGPEALRDQEFYIGINDPLGLNPSEAPFDARAFTLFDAWAGQSGTPQAEARAAVARGQEIFNKRPLDITGVKGLNDELQVGSIPASCTLCHDAPNIGHHSVVAPLDIGIADASRRTPDMPLYTLRNKATGETIRTTDPGRALISGKWKDVGKFKGPILRNLAARAPYFHDGSATRLKDVVDFYDQRFSMKLTPAEKSDLVAFLRTL